MGFIDTLNRIDKRYAWSVLGFALAIIFGGLSLYTEFIRDRHPQLKFEIISDASVLDVREKLGNLAIVYGGIDIQKAQKSLRVVVVRVKNEGPEDILKQHYDDTSPFGFHVLQGTLLRAEILSASNEYLRQTLRVDLQHPDTAYFSPVILEANEFFTIKTLIIHSEGVRPELDPIGKIAGVRVIQKITAADLPVESSFLAQTFSGGPWVQTTRLISYFFGLIILIFAIVAPIAAASGAISKRRRRKHVDQFKSHTKIEPNAQHEFIFERYVENDLGYLRMLQRVAADEGRLQFEVRRYERRKAKQRDVEHIEPRILVSSTGAPPSYIFQNMLPIEDMQASGFIVKTENKWHIEPHLKQTLDEFIKFLEIKRAA